MAWACVDTMWFLPSALNVKVMKFKQARVHGGSNYDSLKVAKRHLISGAHEWINEIPIAPIYYLAKPQPLERIMDLCMAKVTGWGKLFGALACAWNNQVRTGADKGNPTV